jgi:hypothetical protein
MIDYQKLIVYLQVRSVSRQLPSGRSRVLLGVRTTGKLLLCLPPRRNPVLEVSTSDMMPGSSSKSIVEDGGGYPRGRGDCKAHELGKFSRCGSGMPYLELRV